MLEFHKTSIGEISVFQMPISFLLNVRNLNFLKIKLKSNSFSKSHQSIFRSPNINNPGLQAGVTNPHLIDLWTSAHFQNIRMEKYKFFKCL